MPEIKAKAEQIDAVQKLPARNQTAKNRQTAFHEFIRTTRSSAYDMIFGRSPRKRGTIIVVNCWCKFSRYSAPVLDGPPQPASGGDRVTLTKFAIVCSAPWANSRHRYGPAPPSRSLQARPQARQSWRSRDSHRHYNSTCRNSTCRAPRLFGGQERPSLAASHHPRRTDDAAWLTYVSKRERCSGRQAGSASNRLPGILLQCSLPYGAVPIMSRTHEAKTGRIFDMPLL